MDLRTVVLEKQARRENGIVRNVSAASARHTICDKLAVMCYREKWCERTCEGKGDNEQRE
jgi:hypothetical protein